MRKADICPSNDAEWRKYYKDKARETDKQLSFLAWSIPHFVRLALSDKKEDVYVLAQRVLRKLKYPRDRDALLKELGEHPEYQGSILRDEL